jgi:hypothetical protein
MMEAVIFILAAAKAWNLTEDFGLGETDKVAEERHIYRSFQLFIAH